MSQNVAAESNYVSPINPYRAIGTAERAMMYNDSICCKDITDRIFYINIILM
jgi:hypothetical protein